MTICNPVEPGRIRLFRELPKTQQESCRGSAQADPGASPQRSNFRLSSALKEPGDLPDILILDDDDEEDT